MTARPVTDPTQAKAIAELRQWQADGAERVESSPGSHLYRDADAIRLFDAWWPRLIAGVFRPGLGDPLYQAMVNALRINQSPSGQQQGDTTAARFCGPTVLACRADLLATLTGRRRRARRVRRSGCDRPGRS